MYQCAAVSHIKRNDNGGIVGCHSSNLILNISIYESVFLGGEVMEVSINRVAESILTS